MFRRSRFRPIRRLFDTEVPPVLRHAHEQMSLGQFEEAALSYEHLAQGAQAHGLPQDAHLFMVAGHCRIQIKQIDQAMID